MRYRVLKFWEKLGKSCRALLTCGMERSQKFANSFSNEEKILSPADSPHPKFLSPLPLHNNFIMPPVLRADPDLKNGNIHQKPDSCLVFNIFCYRKL